MAPTRYDFVIVGGGSAGCAVANRLSADPGNRVLVLEAGRNDSLWDVFVHMPAALPFPIGSRFYDWKYESEPEPHMDGRRIYHARGKVLGGSSSINGMIFQRGNPMDYERWARRPRHGRLGLCPLPAVLQPDGELPGGGARRPVPRPQRPARIGARTRHQPAVRGVLQGGGAGRLTHAPTTSTATARRGSRSSIATSATAADFRPARAYLHPVMGRPNLDLITRAFVERVVFEGKRAVGVEYRRFGSAKRVNAGQVVLCGGALNSPQLLQLSGVGNAADLQALGIDVVHDLPGVGENLQDHLEVYIQYACKQPVTMQKYLKWRYRPWIGANWLFLRRGPGATNHFEGGGFARSNDDVAYPNLMFHFLPIAVRYDGSSPEGGDGYQVHVGPMYSDARGTVKITTRDPKVHPALRFNYLSTDQDRREWVESIRVARRILNQPAMAPFNGGEISPGPSVETDEQILDWVARDAETALHPSCTAKMGTDAMSVTDPQTMGVHGIDGLKVVDASVMPYVINGNIYAPVMMVAEKAADLILGNQPLSPAAVPFYRYQREQPQPTN